MSKLESTKSSQPLQGGKGKYLNARVPNSIRRLKFFLCLIVFTTTSLYRRGKLEFLDDWRDFFKSLIYLGFGVGDEGQNCSASDVVSTYGTKRASDEQLISRRFNHSPSISSKNASIFVEKRFEEIRADFEEAMMIGNWQSLRSTPFVTIETWDGGNSTLWPMYIRTIATIPTAPSELIKKFRWDDFDTVQKAIDPFYESSRLIFKEGDGKLNKKGTKNLHVLEKTTKRPLFLSKRVMTLGMVERMQLKNVVVPLPKNSQRPTVDIPKGTIINSLVNVKPVGDFKMHSSHDYYVTAFQDFVAWFVEADQGNSTMLVIVMRVDMGNDMPRYPFLATVATVGVISMNRLRLMFL